jgi:hypothetical protein
VLVQRLRVRLTEFFADRRGDPDSRRPRRTMGRAEARLLAAAGSLLFIVLGTAAVLLRQRGIPATDTVYFEDGAVFLRDASRDPIGSFAAPYAGYLHLAPRLIALVAVAAPPAHVAAVFAVASALVLAGLSWFVYKVSRCRIGSPWVRGALAVSILLLPVGQHEVFNTAANLHWFLLYAAFWALLSRPRTGVEAAGSVAIVLLATLSNPFAIVLLPLALGRALALRAAPDQAVTLAFLFGVMLQTVVAVNPAVDRQMVGQEAPQSLSLSFDVPLLVQHYLFHVIGRGTVGSALSGEGRGATGLVVVGIGALLLIAMLGLWSWSSDRSGGGLALAAFCASVGVFAAPWVLSGGILASRYAVPPVLLFYVALAALAHDISRSRIGRSSSFRRGISVLLVPVVFVAAANYRIWSDRSYGPSWSAELAIARTVCEDGSVEEVEVPIHPDWLDVPVRCDELVEGSGR